MPDQPPPDAPSPPSPAALQFRSKRRAIWIIGTGFFLLMIGMGLIKVREQRIMADRVEAISNLRSMSFALYEFQTAYGRFPDDSTARLVREATGTDLSLGSGSSNDYFRQLIAAEIVGSEGLFYARIPGARKPDHVCVGSRTLEKGEVGFSYIAGLTTAGDPKRPLVVTPLIPGTDRFDSKPFGGYAVILPVDGSITRSGPFLRINAKGQVIDSSGKHVLDPANPIWGGVKPVIKWPEL